MASSPLTNNVLPLISRSLTSWIPILESLSGVREANTPTCLPSSPRLKMVLTERDLCRWESEQDRLTMYQGVDPIAIHPTTGWSARRRLPCRSPPMIADHRLKISRHP